MVGFGRRVTYASDQRVWFETIAITIANGNWATERGIL
jgi:hypothetical protein